LVAGLVAEVADLCHTEQFDLCPPPRMARLPTTPGLRGSALRVQPCKRAIGGAGGLEVSGAAGCWREVLADGGFSECDELVLAEVVELACSLHHAADALPPPARWRRAWRARWLRRGPG
jgi:hypothetical protein